jgi:taurine dioxygenase
VHVTAVTGTIGAVVEGIDAAAASEAEVAALREALLEHHVLFLRDQPLTDEQQLHLAGRFGRVSTFPLRALLGATEPTLAHIEDNEQSPPDADAWHTDVSWIAEPPAVAFLSARVIPEVGGDTMWADLGAAYRSLSAPMQRICAGLDAWHWYGDAFAAAVARSGVTQLVEALERAHPAPGVRHPLVRRHPESQVDVLFVSGFIHAIDGMTPEESRAFLDLLQRRLEDPNLQCRWRWRVDDLAIWDERSTNHRALSDHFPRQRRMRRCTVDGDTPRPGGYRAG